MLARRIDISENDFLRNISRKTCRKRAQTVAVRAEKFKVYSRLWIETLSKCFWNHVDEVSVSGFVFDEKDKVVAPWVELVVTVGHRTRRDVDLASNDGLYSFFFACTVKIDHSVHCPVIRYCHACMTRCPCRFRNLRYTARTVEKAVFAVEMKMNEWRRVGNRVRLRRVLNSYILTHSGTALLRLS